MEISSIGQKGSWLDVVNSCRTTINLDNQEKEPKDQWKKQILLAEHSPIRQLIFKWGWINIPYWSSTHFVRHKIGIEHFISTQRTDKTGIDRDEKPQGSGVTHECEANAQAIINISRKRKCGKSSMETRVAWEMFLMELSKTNPILESVCVPECIYRGFCPEFDSCGYSRTWEYSNSLEKYRGICK